MRVVLAPDSFKESLSAAEAAAAMARGARRAVPGLETDEVPLGDGGEGTLEALVAGSGGRWREARVTGPLGETVSARYAFLGDGRTAAIEMAQASGLPLVPPDRRDPLRTTTRGTGELIRDALDQGARRFLVGIGGSATVDGGVGMCQALGGRFLDAAGREIGPGGGEVGRIARIDLSRLDARLRECVVEAACDVTNPLLGDHGAARVFGPQKGATPAAVEALERGLAVLAGRVQADLGKEVREIPGGGAAGGLGAGLVAFLGARLRRGIEIVLDLVGARERFAEADLVLTGEGSLDRTSAYGKVIAGVAALARSAGVPAVALAGQVRPGAEELLAQGLCAFFPIAPGPIANEDSFRRCAELLEAAAEQAVRCFAAGVSSRGAKQK